MRGHRIGSLTLFALLSAVVSCVVAREERGRLVTVEVHGTSLEGNLLGFSPDRETLIYLPPGYDREPRRRYPVLYVLHGITDPPTVWTVPWDPGERDHGSLPRLMDQGIADGRLQEMILVMPDARTPFFGCHYTNSPVKGRWTDFVAEELVQFVDRSYRTLPRADSRGVMGHSMGGHGAIRLGLERPDVFGVVYGLSPSLLGWGADMSSQNEAFELLATVDDPTEHFGTSFYVAAFVGISQAFSPNPTRPPLYADYPFEMQDGTLVPSQPAHRRWEANLLVHRIDAYLRQPARLRGLRFDAGDRDEYPHIPVTARSFSAELSERGVPHTMEIYNGDHRNRLWGERGRLFTEVLPYFSHLLRPDPEPSEVQLGARIP